MPFPLNQVPTELRCPKCDEFITDIELSRGFEFLVARVLKARAAPARNEGYDVYDSVPFPGLTFQVKYANARERPEEHKYIGDREVTVTAGHQWTWHEPKAGAADFYILFGIYEEQVYPFVTSRYIWMENSSNTGKGGRIKIVRAYEYSPCGRYERSAKRNAFWQYYVKSWPADLPIRIKYYTNHNPVTQGSLFESRVPYSVN